MDIDTVAKIISKSQRPLEVRYYLITEEKNNIPKCYRRRTTLSLGVWSVKTAFSERVVFFFLKKKKKYIYIYITLNIKDILNTKNKSDISVL